MKFSILSSNPYVNYIRRIQTVLGRFGNIFHSVKTLNFDFRVANFKWTVLGAQKELDGKLDISECLHS